MNNLKTIYQPSLALIFGACSCFTFLSIYGVIAYWEVKLGLIKWILIVPQSFRNQAYLLHSFLVELCAASLVTAMFGIPLGAITKKNPIQIGVVTFLGLLICYSVYSSIVWEKFMFICQGEGAIYCVFKLGMWLTLFYFMLKIGNSMAYRFQSKENL